MSIAATVGKPVITKIKCCIHDGFVYFVGYRQDREYLYYLLSCGEPYKGLGKLGTQLNLNTDTIGDIYVPLPSLTEQLAIGQFLDGETTRIDGLVAKKERLIELLQEKRAAFITGAVTKGLDPSVSMKDSGIEWLGQIPTHWQVVRLGRLARIENGSTPKRENPEYWSHGTHAWLTSTRINDEVILRADECVTDIALHECHLPSVPADSVLVAMTGEGQTRGRAALLRIPATISQHLASITPRDRRVDSEYLWRMLQSQYDRLRSESGGVGSTRAALTCEYLRSLLLPLPSHAEQLQIASVIHASDDRYASLIRTVREAIGRLQELRIALISAAVTGKIDVRAA